MYIESRFYVGLLILKIPQTNPITYALLISTIPVKLTNPFFRRYAIEYFYKSDIQIFRFFIYK